VLREQWLGRVEYNKNSLKKNNQETTHIKTSKSIKRTNIGQSQHPSSGLLQLIIDAYISIRTLNMLIRTIFLSLLSCSQLENKQSN
jgi:hypothetical protein